LKSEVYALENARTAAKLYQQHKDKDFGADLLSGRDDVLIWDETSLHIIAPPATLDQQLMEPGPMS
jgi:hypothetical protein